MEAILTAVGLVALVIAGCLLVARAWPSSLPALAMHLPAREPERRLAARSQERKPEVEGEAHRRAP